MTASFTPGPWDIYRQPISGAGDAILELVEQVQATDPIGDTLFLINAGGKCPAVTGCGPTSEANARLIAAAPELYEALIGMLPVVFTGSPTSPQNIAHWERERELENGEAQSVLAAYAALAKARGEA